MRHKLMIAAVLACVGATSALAQDKGPNGGLLGGKGTHQTELVVTETELTVFVLDRGKTHDAKGTNLRAVIQQDGQNQTVPLKLEPGNKMVGKLTEPLKAGAIVVLLGKDHHGDLFNSRYVIKP